jgi:hypothetical protein
MMFTALVVLVAVLAVVNAKMVEVRQNVLVMDEKDRVVGKTEHVFFRNDELKATPPPMPGKYLSLPKRQLLYFNGVTSYLSLIFLFQKNFSASNEH